MVKPLDHISYSRLFTQHLFNLHIPQVFEALRNILIILSINWSKLFVYRNGKV